MTLPHKARKIHPLFVQGFMLFIVVFSYIPIGRECGWFCLPSAVGLLQIFVHFALWLTLFVLLLLFIFQKIQYVNRKNQPSRIFSIPFVIVLIVVIITPLIYTQIRLNKMHQEDLTHYAAMEQRLKTEIPQVYEERKDWYQISRFTEEPVYNYAGKISAINVSFFLSSNSQSQTVLQLVELGPWYADDWKRGLYFESVLLQNIAVNATPQLFSVLALPARSTTRQYGGKGVLKVRVLLGESFQGSAVSLSGIDLMSRGEYSFPREGASSGLARTVTPNYYVPELQTREYNFSEFVPAWPVR